MRMIYDARTAHNSSSWSSWSLQGERREKPINQFALEEIDNESGGLKVWRRLKELEEFLVKEFENSKKTGRSKLEIWNLEI